MGVGRVSGQMGKVSPMADEEHLRILKQGVEVWNQWRERNTDVQPDLSEARLTGANLTRGNFVRADLSDADLSETSLIEAKLIDANLGGAYLIAANLSAANLSGADLTAANLMRADLTMANLTGADLTAAGLIGTDLRGADLRGANLNGADIVEADLRGATVGWSTFVDIDFSGVEGLDAVIHEGPSSIGIDTIYRSKGNIPEVFLRGAGVPDSFIEYMASLVGKPIEFYSCFISYSSKDQAFAEPLYTDLQAAGTRCWFAPDDMRIGDRIRPTLDWAIRSYDKLLLVLSEHSIDSDWVEKEVETAFEEERKRKTTILFPIRLDSAVMETDQAWVADIRRTRHIGDFTNWKDHDAYQKAFERLLRDLKAEEGAEADT